MMVYFNDELKERIDNTEKIISEYLPEAEGFAAVFR